MGILTFTWLVPGFFLALCAMKISQWFFVAVFALLIAVGTISLIAFRCPFCKKSVLNKKKKLLGLNVSYWDASIPIECPHCGKML